MATASESLLWLDARRHPACRTPSQISVICRHGFLVIDLPRPRQVLDGHLTIEVMVAAPARRRMLRVVQGQEDAIEECEGETGLERWWVIASRTPILLRRVRNPSSTRTGSGASSDAPSLLRPHWKSGCCWRPAFVASWRDTVQPCLQKCEGQLEPSSCDHERSQAVNSGGEVEEPPMPACERMNCTVAEPL